MSWDNYSGFKFKVDGTIVTATQLYVKIDGTLKSATHDYTKVDGFNKLISCYANCICNTDDCDCSCNNDDCDGCACNGDAYCSHCDGWSWCSKDYCSSVGDCSSDGCNYKCGSHGECGPAY